MKRSLLSFVCAAAFVVARAEAGEVQVDGRFETERIGRSLEVGLDATGRLEAAEVRAGALPFKQSERLSPNFGTVDGALWARFRLVDARAEGAPLVLEQGDANADTLRVYVDDAPPIVSGDHSPFSSWPIRAREPAVEIPAGSHEVLVELRGGMTKHFPLALYTREAYAAHRSADDLAQGLYFGAILALTLYNLLLFAATKLRVYGLYAATIGCVALVQFTVHGLGTRLVWGDLLGLNDRLSIAGPFLAFAFGTLFFVDVLRLEARRPREASVLRGRLVPAFLVAGVVATAAPFGPGSAAAAIGAIAWALVVLAVSVREVLAGDRVARIVVLAWLALLGGVALFALRTIGLLPSNELTVNGMQVGSVIEAVLLSLALADRIKELQHEVSEKQALALANAEAALEAREQAMAELEERRKLQGELDAASHRLAQAENMATLGMLMAGIAHDLRNPLNYVQSASENLQEVQHDLDTDDADARGRAVATVRRVTGWIDQGVRTMDALSVAMRNQSRNPGASGADDGDDDPRTAVSLGEVVREALLLCRSRAAHCEVSLEIEEATVYADPTGLGQLVMNLVSNAADALLERRNADPGQRCRVLVRAARIGAGFTLEVHDSGPGIPEALRAKILEPFFSTKPRGQGTGLGLAIVQRVVRQHEGILSIDASPELGGARFAIVCAGMGPRPS